MREHIRRHRVDAHTRTHAHMHARTHVHTHTPPPHYSKGRRALWKGDKKTRRKYTQVLERVRALHTLYGAGNEEDADMYMGRGGVGGGGGWGEGELGMGGRNARPARVIGEL